MGLSVVTIANQLCYAVRRGISYTRKENNQMAIFNFELFVDVEADDFESALSWLKAMPLERQLDFHVIDYREIEG
jgi:hypothetical protein